MIKFSDRFYLEREAFQSVSVNEAGTGIVIGLRNLAPKILSAEALFLDEDESVVDRFRKIAYQIQATDGYGTRDPRPPQPTVTEVNA